MTLTWNGENELGSGHTTTHGMTGFGRQAVREMEDRGILVDVSHLNDTGYADLFETARRPFVATHSNARSICSHKRNLTDDMIREMVRRNCLIGLNYYTGFITNDENYDDPENFYRHIEHFFELGAYENLALGSDFDGAHLPTYLNTPAKAANLYEYFLEKGMSKELAEGIMFRNCRRIFQKKSVICIRLPANAHYRHVNAFCVTGNSSKLPVTQKGRVKNEALFFTRPSRPILFRFRIIFKFFQDSLNSAFYQNAGIQKAVQILCLLPFADQSRNRPTNTLEYALLIKFCFSTDIFAIPGLLCRRSVSGYHIALRSPAR